MINKHAIFEIKTKTDFTALALEVFRVQYNHNGVYRSFCDLLNKHPSDINTIKNIPFLPIQFFKTHKVLTGHDVVEKMFQSSGTSNTVLSKHYVTDISIYKSSFINGFQHFYGAIDDYIILALLPNYSEQENASLIYMVNELIRCSKHPQSNFYLKNLDQLATSLHQLDKANKKVLLLGVSYALLDLVEKHHFDLKHITIMETGGMKGRRKEMIRVELHERLKQGLGVQTIHSEYGMTELLSQAYSKGNGIFKTPPWMKILIREPNDALHINPVKKTGGINIIDLANINSCAFIATQDLGKIYSDGSFEVLGRFDYSDLRGCNLMAL